MTHRRALVLLAAAVVLFFAPLFARRQVIFPHSNARQVWATPADDGAYRSYSKFNDQSLQYVPELHHQLRGDASGWIATWAPAVELGRPAWHTYGLSKAYPLTHALSLVSRDAFAVYTALAALTVALGVLFGFLFLRELGLSPAACLAGALALGMGVFPLFWLTFPMFLGGLTWTLALLWLAARFAARGGLATGAGIAFATYALLLSGYPQQIAWHAWLLALAAGLLLLRAPGSRAERLRRAAVLVACVVAGLLAAAPVYADLALQASRSARMSVDSEFFLRALPPPGRRARGELAAQLFDVLWCGDPLEESYDFKGFSLTPLYAGLAVASLAAPRRAWPWILFAGLAFVLALSPRLYVLAVEHLGLGLSRFSPLNAAHVPLLVAAAIGADLVLHAAPRRRRWLALAVLAPPAVALLGLYVGVRRGEPEDLAWGLALAAGTFAFVWSGSRTLLVALAVASLLHYGWALMLARPESSIHTSSALVERVRALTRDDSRYVWVGKDPVGVLPPNEELLLGLSSVHSYDSLSPLAYQRWAERVSPEGTQVHGRYFLRISDDSLLDALELERMNAGVILSSGPLRPEIAEPLGEIDGIGLHRPARVGRREAQLAEFRLDGEGHASIEGLISEAGELPLERLRDQDDALGFAATTVERPTLLWLSQQHHPQWQATAEGARLETVTVDGIWQGVLLPPGTRTVELRFRPWARWSFVPQLVFALAFAALGVVALVRPPGRAAGRGV